MADMNDEMQEIFEGFLVETEELLDQVSQDLVELEDKKDDPDFINGIFRGFHTIKGTSSFMGFDEISSITHEAEYLLNKLRKNEIDPSPEITDVLLEVHDWIRTLLDFRRNGEEPEYNYEETIAKIVTLRGDDPKGREDKSSSLHRLANFLGIQAGHSKGYLAIHHSFLKEKAKVSQMTKKHYFKLLLLK